MPNRSKVAFTTRFSASATESTPSTTTSADQPPYVEIYDPCDDFWSPFCYSFGFNRLTFEFGIVALLVMIQLSMLLLIVARCRRDPSFRQAFYAQFVAVTIVDCLRMFMQLFDLLRLPMKLYENPEFSPSYTRVTSAIGNIPQYAQSMLHLVIAVNRFTAFFAPLSHDSLWGPRVVGGSLAASLVLAVLLHVIPFYGLPWISGDPGGAQWAHPLGVQVEIDNILSAGVCFLAAVVGFALSVATVAKLRSLAKSGQMREANNRRDATLLLYSIFMVLVQLLVTAVTVITVITAFAQKATISLDFIGTEEFQIYVNQVWYKIVLAIAVPLITYLPPNRLAELYSLSGSLFLLLISSQVRSAYLEFYLKRSPRIKKVIVTPVTSIVPSPFTRPNNDTEKERLSLSRSKHQRYLAACRTNRTKCPDEPKSQVLRFENREFQMKPVPGPPQATPKSKA